jgi:2',3'-cyclic-nucleotide 2'-phosphodiesterase (5'-nucleotidase family)
MTEPPKSAPKFASKYALRPAPQPGGLFRRINIVLFLAVGAAVLASVAYVARQPGEGKTGGGGALQTERHVTFLTINDVYRVEGVAEGKAGGLSRVRTLRRWIERDAPNAILLHAGDFLSPSLVSRETRGASMIEAMNGLDGDTKAFDDRMFVTFGNHEFDVSTCGNPNPSLNARVEESQFTWLVANLDFPTCAGMKGMLDRKNVRKDGLVVEVDGVKLGLFGIGQTPEQAGSPLYPGEEKALPAARRSIAFLRERGAELIVAITHLSRAEDEELIQQLTGAGLDLVVGGHDHNHMVLLDGEGVARGFKADSDARTAWRIDVHMMPGGRPRVSGQLIALNEAVPPDNAVAAIGKASWAQAEADICRSRAAKKSMPYQEGCLSGSIGRTQTAIELEETSNRMQETGFGDWLADLVARTAGADVAIVNSGMLGLGEDLDPGTPLSLEHVLDIIRFDDVIAVETFPARVVCAAIAHGFAVPGRGAWPHVSGVDVDVRRGQGKYDAAVKDFRGKSGVSCDSDDPIKVAAPPYLLCSGDGYSFLPRSRACVRELSESAAAKGAPLFTDVLEAAIRAGGDTGIRPEKDGRIRYIGSAK